VSSCVSNICHFLILALSGLTGISSAREPFFDVDSGPLWFDYDGQDAWLHLYDPTLISDRVESELKFPVTVKVGDLWSAAAEYKPEWDFETGNDRHRLGLSAALPCVASNSMYSRARWGNPAGR